ncbi:site-specific DNA-methyltransferase [Clostridium botulinum]|nr:site-specific DNA-methyltransferase [Clostridium botulinum]
MLEQNQIYLGDCLELMKDIRDKSIDLILCDLPYGTTKCKWDTVIPLEPLWKQYNRIIKDSGAIVLFGSQPFTSTLIMSNIKDFRYEIIWEKTMPTLFQHANKRPMLKHENIVVFYKKQPTYNPQFSEGEPYTRKEGSGNRKVSGFHGNAIKKSEIKNEGKRYPTTILKYSNGNHNRLHPTEKNIELLEWLIKTYTDENEIVLDNCMGSGSTIVACKNTNRNYIGIEKDEHYYNTAYNRINGYIYK